MIVYVVHCTVVCTFCDALFLSFSYVCLVPPPPLSILTYVKKCCCCWLAKCMKEGKDDDVRGSLDSTHPVSSFITVLQIYCLTVGTLHTGAASNLCYVYVLVVLYVCGMPYGQCSCLLKLSTVCAHNLNLRSNLGYATNHSLVIYQPHIS